MTDRVREFERVQVKDSRRKMQFGTVESSDSEYFAVEWDDDNGLRGPDRCTEYRQAQIDDGDIERMPGPRMTKTTFEAMFGPEGARHTVEVSAGLKARRIECGATVGYYWLDEFPEDLFPADSMCRHDAIHYGIVIKPEYLKVVDDPGNLPRVEVGDMSIVLSLDGRLASIPMDDGETADACTSDLEAITECLALDPPPDDIDGYNVELDHSRSEVYIGDASMTGDNCDEIVAAMYDQKKKYQEMMTNWEPYKELALIKTEISTHLRSLRIPVQKQEAPEIENPIVVSNHQLRRMIASVEKVAVGTELPKFGPYEVVRSAAGIKIGCKSVPLDFLRDALKAVEGQA